MRGASRVLGLMVAALAVALVLSQGAAPGTPSPSSYGSAAYRVVSVEMVPQVTCPPVPTGTLATNVSATAKPTPADVGSSLNFYGIFKGFSGPTWLNWSFGDGSCSTAQYPVHAYTSPGLYTVVFWVNSTCCMTHSTTFQLQINSAVESGVSFLPTDPSTSTVVNFTATPSQGTPPYVGFWNFGDGDTATGLSVLHTFHAAGTYTVRLWANDSGAGSAPQTLQVTVTGSGGSGFLGGNTGLLVGTSIAAVAVALLGFGYFQWDKHRRPKLADPSQSILDPPRPP